MPRRFAVLLAVALLAACGSQADPERLALSDEEIWDGETLLQDAHVGCAGHSIVVELHSPEPHGRTRSSEVEFHTLGIKSEVGIPLQAGA